MLRPLVCAAIAAVTALPLAAQAPAPAPATGPDSATFVVTKGADTLIVEHFLRSDRQVVGELIRRAAAGRRETYKGLLTPDGSVPLVEFAVWNGDDPADRTPRQRVRVIFKDDSVAMDEVNSAEMMTRTFGSQKGAIPYLNLSFALLEQATRRLVMSMGDSVAVPFFNLNGGQTAVGTLRRIPGDSATLQLGSVAFRLHLDKEGRLLGATIPEQGVRAERAGS
jgi:hypothetical protein